MMSEIEKILEFEEEEDGDGELDIDSFPPVWLGDSSPSLPLPLPIPIHSPHRSFNKGKIVLLVAGAFDATEMAFTEYEDMVQLEWLSHFFKDSLSKSKLLPICHAKRTRSKRPRPACFNPRFSIQLLPPKKRLQQPKKKSKDPIPISYRKCTHCEITETPQWREGPSGPKTLCNACGVRYKKGMLFPEYRPAASPTFVPSLHSNSYRKVFEMRKSKNGDEIVQPELLQNSKSHNKGLELIECSSLHSNSHMKAMEMRKGKNGDEIVQPELLRNSKSHNKDLELIECSSLHSNSHMKAIKLKKGKNGDEIGQPELFCNTNPHDEGLELVECPISVITTDVSSFLPEFHPAMTKSDVGLLQK